MEQQRTHQPKGGMCTTCARGTQDCSALAFERMPVIARDDTTGAMIVRCTEHTRAAEPAPEHG